MHSFPNGACERTSALLAVALSLKYPSSHVMLVRGCRLDRYELHFWVEVDGHVLDPTAHQFNGYLAPLICHRPSPLESIFPRDTEHVDPTSTTDLPANSNGAWYECLAALREFIDA